MTEIDAAPAFLASLFSDVFFVNERIMAGDICSAKTALPRVRKLIEDHSRLIVQAGGKSVRIEPYQAAGGWVGLTYSFVINGKPCVGSTVPRRV